MTKGSGRPSQAAAQAIAEGRGEARALMVRALEILDYFPGSAAAATLDLAIHHLDRELGAGRA